MHDPASELPRIPLLGTGVKIALAEAHLHGFGGGLAGPWITWVNKGKRKAEDSPLRFTYASEGFLDRPIPLELGATNPLLDQSA